MKRIGWAIELLRKDGKSFKVRLWQEGFFTKAPVVYSEDPAQKELAKMQPSCRMVPVFVE